MATSSEIYHQSAQLAREQQGHYMDQFTYAERATDWRSNNNIAESIFRQMQDEPYPVPHTLVMSAGTGVPLPRSVVTYAIAVPLPAFW